MLELEKWVLPDLGTSNILGLSNPKNIVCRVCYYRNSHSIMRIELDKGDREDYIPPQLILESPTYFEGSFQWQSAEFNVAPEEEFLNLFEKMKTSGSPARLSTKITRLYEILVMNEAKPIAIRFMAARIMLTKKRIKIGMIWP
jgi:hypothetical protein